MNSIKYARGHDLHDQCPVLSEQQQSSIQLQLNVFQMLSLERNELIPNLLTGEALIWYVHQEEHMPTFTTFMKKLLHDDSYQELKTESPQTFILSPTPLMGPEMVDSTETVMDCFRNQMLITNIEKLQKISDHSNQHVSKWLREIQHTMNMFKLTDREELFYISLCLAAGPRDWNSGISFYRLRLFERGLNEDVRQYDFDIMRLCKEANPLMDDAHKLQYFEGCIKTFITF
ncbi:unnamed protein product [Rotaria sp. Silwood2]|nr:unnamed protein product [Rotaria sp. Silwood2]CAF4379037.1 unnamed protein product [Rotaria sp. Silwood2]